MSTAEAILDDASVRNEVGAGRPADADNEPPHRPRARTSPTRGPPAIVVDAGSLCDVFRFPGEPARGVRLLVMSVLYWTDSFRDCP